MKDDYCHISIVIDRSGSMNSIASDTVGGLVNFVEEQKKVPGKATFSLMQFDDKFDNVYDFSDINNVDILSQYNFQPRGMTALYDAIGKSIVEVGESLSDMDENDRPSKVIFVIITDGAENSSREYSLSQVRKMIEEQTNKYSWEFVFLGANIDAEVVGTSFGMKAGNTITYAANAKGVDAAYSSVTSNLTAFRSSASLGSSYTFFSQSDRDKQVDAGA